MKPTLVYMYDSLSDVPDQFWPELGGITPVDSEMEYKLRDPEAPPEMWRGSVYGLGEVVISLEEGSELSLRLLEDEGLTARVLCLSVRRRPGLWVGWWQRLESLAKLHGVGIAEHTRHDVLEVLAFRRFRDGLRALESCADLLRGEGVDPSSEAMKTEMALTRAIEALRATGFRAPKKR